VIQHSHIGFMLKYFTHHLAVQLMIFASHLVSAVFVSNWCCVICSYWTVFIQDIFTFVFQL